MYESLRDTERTNELSINWCLGDEQTEVTIGSTGNMDPRHASD